MEIIQGSFIKKSPICSTASPEAFQKRGLLGLLFVVSLLSKLLVLYNTSTLN